MTVRQSTKRGMTPQMTPDNPMAASQKYMAYVVPLFALSGLYWAFGLVMYWVTTNVWTLGQQYVLFKRYPMPVPGAVAGAAGPGGTTVPAKPAVTSKPSSGKALPAKPTGPAKPATATPSPAAPGRGQPGRKPPAMPSSAKTAAGSGQASANGSGMLRRLSRRSEPEPPPPPQPDTKIVRQQPSRQSRRKRSGKR